MRVLSNKKINKLFDDILLLSVMGIDSLRELATEQHPDAQTLIRRQSLMIETTLDIASALKGMLGIHIAMEFQNKLNDLKLIHEEAKAQIGGKEEET